MAENIYSESTLLPAGPVSGDGDLLTEKQIKTGLLKNSRERVLQLLPIAQVSLTPAQQALVSREQQARLTLGPCVQSAMVCGGAQCPVAFQCSLQQMKKAPDGERCPFELNYVAERFASWLESFDRTVEDLLEPERITISNLVELDVEEYRIRTLVAHYNRAKLTSQVVRDVNAETGEPLCWEDVIDPLLVRLADITTSRRMLLKDFELTPEMQTKKQKALGIHAGNDLANRHSSLSDRVRKALEE